MQSRNPPAHLGSRQLCPVGNAGNVAIRHALRKIASVMRQRERGQASLIAEMAEKTVEILRGALVHPWRVRGLLVVSGETVRQHFAQPREIDRAHAGMKTVGILGSKAKHAVGMFFAQRDQCG